MQKSQKLVAQITMTVAVILSGVANAAEPASTATRPVVERKKTASTPKVMTTEPKVTVPEPEVTATEPKVMTTEPSLGPVAESVVEALRFRPWVVTVHFSPLDLMLPNKLGASVAHRGSENSMWELEYTHGSFAPFIIDDLGKFTEERFSLLRRFTSKENSGFQWFYGAFYHRFKLQIGNAVLSRLSGGTYPSTDVISIGGVGATVGLGYRWLIKESFVISLDGAAWAQPFKTTNRDTRFLDVVTNQNDRTNIESGIKVMEYFPRFAVLKISGGYSF